MYSDCCSLPINVSNINAFLDMNAISRRFRVLMSIIPQILHPQVSCASDECREVSPQA
jgi:hypothetical protein